MSAEKNISANPPVHFELLKAGAGRFSLVLSGHLDADSAPQLWHELKHKLAATPVTALTVDATGLSYCDSAGLALLYSLSSGLSHIKPHARVTMTGLKPDRKDALQNFSLEDYQAFLSEQPIKPSVPEEVGIAVKGVTGDLGESVAFIGKVTSAMSAILRVPRMIRWHEVMRIFEIAGVNALPIVSLISLLVGLIIAFEAAQPLAQFGAQIYVANLIGLVMVRELGPVMAAILLAGRSGSAFAAELGTMKVNEELNALETMGLDPVQFLVVQRLTASLLLTPLLTIYAMFTGVLGGALVMVGLGFPMPMILNQLESSVKIGDIAFGTGKGFVFGVVVAGIGCLRGLQTKEGPSAVGASTTRAVVSGIVLIVILDALFAGLMFTLKQ